jgi:hypothetical protein
MLACKITFCTEWLVLGLAFATRPASAEELKVFRLLLSIYRDGSGAERESDGTTRANWRQIERCVADLLGADTSEDKNIFDVIAQDQGDPTLWHGYSVKSKQLAARKFANLNDGERVYMEIANSPAKFWDAIRVKHGLDESAFSAQSQPQELGDTVIETVESWHSQEKVAFQARTPGCTLDLDTSNYFCLSYSQQSNPDDREYQVHIFPLSYPKGIHWEFTSARCLRGYDPDYPGETLLDWYGVSGGQLKYYPKAKNARFSSPVFKLLTPPQKSAMEKAEMYFPTHFA